MGIIARETRPVPCGHGYNSDAMDDLDAAFLHYKKVDPVFYTAGKRVRKMLAKRSAPRSGDRLFASLAESVVSQQLSVKASDTIWKRLEIVCGGRVTPASILAAPLPRMRTAGLSAAKAKTLKELARAVTNGLRLSGLRKQSPEQAIEALTAVWGIGPWTAEMFLMFGLGHPDIFSARDLGLIRSMETLYGIPKDSKREVYETVAAQWSPHRSTACRILWRLRDMP